MPIIRTYTKEKPQYINCVMNIKEKKMCAFQFRLHLSFYCHFLNCIDFYLSLIVKIIVVIVDFVKATVRCDFLAKRLTV
jgi:hypothetical protein